MLFLLELFMYLEDTFKQVVYLCNVQYFYNVSNKIHSYNNNAFTFCLRPLLKCVTLKS